MKCEACGRDATVHLTAVSAGVPRATHLCEPCSWDREGLAFPNCLSPAGTGVPVVVKFAPWSPHQQRPPAGRDAGGRE